MSMTWRASLAGLAFAAAALYGAAALSQAQPYAGFQARTLKALSDDQVADLRAGRGMGLALAAELNGYPGPLHVLELADALKLDAGQRDGVRRLFAAMKAEAVPLGEQLIAREADLDRAFAARAITPESLAAMVAAIGQAQAQLRAAHLKYHLQTPTILNEQQVRRYAELRGYAGDGHHRRHHPH